MSAYSKRNMLVGAAWIGGGGAARVTGIALAPVAGVARRAPFAPRALVALDEVGRREQERARDRAERSLDAVLHRAVASDWAGHLGLAERLLTSPQADAALRRLLTGPVVDRIVVALVETRVVERATAELIAAEVPERILEQVLEGQVVDEVVTRLLADDSLRAPSRRCSPAGSRAHSTTRSWTASSPARSCGAWWKRSPTARR